MEQQQRPSTSIDRIGSKVIVSIRGSLDSEATPLFAHFIEDLIDGKGNLNVVIDLRDVPSVDPRPSMLSRTPPIARTGISTSS